MTELYLAAALFVGIHLLISATGLRGLFIGLMGEKIYRGVFSIASIGAIWWLSMAYNDAWASPENVWNLWAAPVWAVHLGYLVMPVAFLLAVVGLTTPSPTTVGLESRLEKGGDAATGILRITRHPFLWGVFLWAAYHLAVNPDLASVVLFGSLAVLVFFGTFSIDRKRRARFGAKWEPFARATSNVPFAAILSGRQKLSLGEIGWWRLVLALALFGLLLYLHGWLFGVSILDR